MGNKLIHSLYLFFFSTNFRFNLLEATIKIYLFAMWSQDYTCLQSSEPLLW